MRYFELINGMRWKPRRRYFYALAQNRMGRKPDKVDLVVSLLAIFDSYTRPRYLLFVKTLFPLMVTQSLGRNAEVTRPPLKQTSMLCFFL